nr:reverse transcriptase domain-containing protein [Tanacetum cinerariifolium]
MTHLLEKEKPFVFSKECIEAFNTLKKKLTEAPILVVPDWNLPFELICDASDYAIGCKAKVAPMGLLLQEFDITILDKKGSENLAADHLSRLKNPHQDVLENKDINENIPLETLGSLTSNNTPWFADIVNFYAGKFFKKGLTSQQKKKFFKDLLNFSKLAMRDLPEAIMVLILQRRRVMIKYGVTHRLATAYHPQMSGQVEVKNKQEKDKIRTKPDQIKKKQEAWKSPVVSRTNHSQNIRKRRKYKVQGPKQTNPRSCIHYRKKTRTEIANLSNYKDKDLFCLLAKVVRSRDCT